MTRLKDRAVAATERRRAAPPTLGSGSCAVKTDGRDPRRGQPAIEAPIERPEDRPLDVHDVRPVAGERAAQAGEPGHVLGRLRRPAQPGADVETVRPPVEVLNDAVALGGGRVSVHERRRPQRHPVTAGGEAAGELVVVRARVARRIDQRNVQGSGV
jgi:hypothetical protein